LRGQGGNAEARPLGVSLPSVANTCAQGGCRTLVIMEPEVGGHHFALHVETLVANLSDASGRILVLTSVRHRYHSIIAAFQERWRGKASVQFFEAPVFPGNPTPLGILHYQFKQYAALRKVHKDLRLAAGSHVYLAQVTCPIPFALFGSAFGQTSYSTLYMHSPAALLVRSGWRARAGRLVKVWIMRRMLRDQRLQHMFYINELTRPVLAAFPPDLRAKAVLLADCCHDMAGFDRSQARRDLGIDDTRFVLLAVGELTARKGVSRLLGAAAAVWSHGDVPLCLLVGGSSDRLSLSDRATLRQHAQTPARCLFFDGFQPTRQLKLMFAASDAVWLAYEGFSEMSGVLMQSVEVGIPIIATADGLIGYLANKYHLGPAIPGRSVARAVEAIEGLYRDHLEYAKYVRGCAEMKQVYSDLPFGATIATLLTQAVATASASCSTTD